MFLDKIKQFLEEKQLLGELIGILKTAHIPGFKGVSLYDAYRYTQKEIDLDAIQIKAAGIAFNAILATFPAVIAFLTIVASFPRIHFEELFLDFLTYFFPEDVSVILLNAIADISFASGSIGLFSLSLIASIYFASNGVRTLMVVFRKDTPHFKERTFFKRQFISVGVTLSLMFMIMLTLTGIVGGKYLIHVYTKFFVVESWFLRLIISGFRALWVFFLIYNSITLIYVLLPATRFRWGYFTPGAIIASLLIIISSKGFFFFAENFGSYGRLYGSLGGTMIILLWIYIIAILLLVGFELNVGLLHRPQRREEIG